MSPFAPATCTSSGPARENLFSAQTLLNTSNGLPVNPVAEARGGYDGCNPLSTGRDEVAKDKDMKLSRKTWAQNVGMYNIKNPKKTQKRLTNKSCEKEKSDKSIESELKWHVALVESSVVHKIQKAFFLYLTEMRKRVYKVRIFDSNRTWSEYFFLKQHEKNVVNC